jgi:hypothetical protein
MRGQLERNKKNVTAYYDVMFNIFQVFSLIWSVLVACAFSVLIHSTDSDVGGSTELLTFSGVVSVVSVAVILLVPMILCSLMFTRRGWRGFTATLFLNSLVLGALMTMAGSTAGTVRELSVSLGGAVGIFAAVIGLGTLPHIRTKARRVRSV